MSDVSELVSKRIINETAKKMRDRIMIAMSEMQGLVEEYDKAFAGADVQEQTAAGTILLLHFGILYSELGAPLKQMSTLIEMLKTVEKEEE
jgi:hypothetical protein